MAIPNLSRAAYQFRNTFQSRSRRSLNPRQHLPPALPPKVTRTVGRPPVQLMSFHVGGARSTSSVTLIQCASRRRTHPPKSAHAAAGSRNFVRLVGRAQDETGNHSGSVMITSLAVPAAATDAATRLHTAAQAYQNGSGSVAVSWIFPVDSPVPCQ